MIVRELGSVCDVTTGQSAPQSEDAFSTTGIPFIRAGSLEPLLAGKAESSLELIDDFSAKKHKLKLFPKDTILFAKSGMSAKLARVYRIKSPCYVVSHLAAILPSEVVDPGYLHRWFEANPPSNLIANDAYPSIKTSEISKVKIPLPPLPEQKRIAAILDKADAIRRKRQQAIQLADDFLRAVFLDMFGDPVTNPKGWEVRTVSEYLNEGVIFQVQDGNHGNDHPKVSDFIEEGIPFVTANVVRRGKVLFDKCYYLGSEWLSKLRVGFAQPRDVLISHKGSLGFTAVLDDSFRDYIFSPQTTYYRLDESRLIPEYLKAYFDSGFFQALFEKEGVQSTRAYVGITRQKELPIMLPGIQAQREFVAISAQLESMIEKLVNSSDELPNCLDALSQKAFSGQL